VTIDEHNPKKVAKLNKSSIVQSGNNSQLR